MIIDARRGTLPAPLDCDLCIVGAGAAGLTVALELAKTGLSICVLESGGLHHDNALQPTLAGETGDSDFPPLHTVRIAGLGGSMQVWAGWCRPLDEIDFEERKEIPHSGWPFGLDELRPYYARAHELLDIGPYDYDPAGWESQSGTQRLGLGRDDFSSVIFRRSAVNFGMSQRDTLTRSENVRVLLNANVMRLRFTRDCRAVTAVEVATLNDRKFDVRPRTVVVAAGGIETARLMLLSSEVERGPGNENGLVGRYFTEHGYDDGACYIPADPRCSLLFYYPQVINDNAGRRVARGALAPTAGTLRREGLLNCAIQLRPAYEAHPIFGDPRVQAALELWDMLRSRAVPDRRLAKALYGLSGPRALMLALWRRLQGPPKSNLKLPLLSLFECPPDPDNRIVLGATRDALGRRVARVQWHMSELGLRSVARTYQLLDAGLRSAGLGHVLVRSSAFKRSRKLKGALGEHHLGTTRMHRDPTQGVVNQDSRVHGVDNLFIAGGSAFTTGGFANPTLTVIALALRLAAHLDQRIRRLP